MQNLESLPRSWPVRIGQSKINPMESGGTLACGESYAPTPHLLQDCQAEFLAHCSPVRLGNSQHFVQSSEKEIHSFNGWTIFLANMRVRDLPRLLFTILTFGCWPRCKCSCFKLTISEARRPKERAVLNAMPFLVGTLTPSALTR